MCTKKVIFISQSNDQENWPILRNVSNKIYCCASEKKCSCHFLRFMNPSFLSFSFQHSSGLGNVFSSSKKKKKCKSSTNGRSLKPIWKHFWECSLCYVILTFCRFFFTYSGGCCCVVYIMQSLNKLALFHLPMFWFLYNGYGFGWGRGFRSSRLRVTFFLIRKCMTYFFWWCWGIIFQNPSYFLVLLFF